MLHAVIMAGGTGTRFWPASRESRPKQLLALVGEDTMIQSTVGRLDGLVPADDIMIVTNRRLVSSIRAEVPDAASDAVIGEPCKRDTAPCIGLAAALLAHEDPEAIMLVMPADHVISPVESFHEAVTRAVRVVESEPARLVTFGIRPTYPAEGFGYIEQGRRVHDDAISLPIHVVEQFREKPDRKTAERYLSEGRFFWNSGIFVWRAATILAAIERYEPEMRMHLQVIAESVGTAQFEDVLDREFAMITPKSIDYAVMEHYPDVVVIEAPFDWDDVGGWQSIARLKDSDSHGNTVRGKHVGHDTHHSIVRSENGHLIATLGVRDLIIVHTPDATLVANKRDEESIRKLVELLEQRGWTQYL